MALLTRPGFVLRWRLAVDQKKYVKSWPCVVLGRPSMSEVMTSSPTWMDSMGLYEPSAMRTSVPRPKHAADPGDEPADAPADEPREVTSPSVLPVEEPFGDSRHETPVSFDA